DGRDLVVDGLRGPLGHPHRSPESVDSRPQTGLQCVPPGTGLGATCLGPGPTDPDWVHGWSLTPAAWARPRRARLARTAVVASAARLLHKQVLALPVRPRGWARRESNVASDDRSGPEGPPVVQSMGQMTSCVCCISRGHARLETDVLLLDDTDPLAL